MSDIATVYAVFGSQEEAERIGRAMIEKRLAACVNILGSVQSIYRWQGTLETGAEVPALFKTSKAQAALLIAAISDRHSYDIPTICQWPIRNSVTEYAQWVLDETETQE